MGRRKNKNKTTTVCVVEKKKPKLTYTPRMEKLLLDISDNISFAIMGSLYLENEFGYKLLDISDKPGTFKVHIHEKGISYIKIADFIKNIFENKINIFEVDRFIIEYNKRISNEDEIEYFRCKVSYFEQDEFEYKPLEPYYTFLSLCYKTYPHGTEDKVLKYMPVPGLLQDDYGNYYCRIGESDTMFTSHLDSACRQHENVKLLTYKLNGQRFVVSDGKTILSADDKAGVTVMLYMIANNIPGLYYFFLGEERGGIGSGLLASDYDKHEHLVGINKCISFDRRNYHSIITHQGGRRCCSDAFANSLCEELNKNGLSMQLDNGGLFTDSANFIQNIIECTNVSVGYFKEHSTDEIQNISYLEALCKACVKVNWEKLVVRKQAAINKQILERNNELLTEFRQLNLFCDTPVLRTFESSPDAIYIVVKLGAYMFNEAYEDITAIGAVVKKFYENNNVFFVEDNDGGTLMNIELK